MYIGSNKSIFLTKRDLLLNKIIAYVNVSECKTKIINVNFSNTFINKKIKVGKFFDKSTLVDFNTKMKKTFTPVGGIFTMKLDNDKNGEVSIMFIEANKDAMIDITIEKTVSEKSDWDILTRNNKIVDDLKKDVFSTLGMF